MSSAYVPIYQIKVTLLRSNPPIWRRLLVSSETTLDRMHDILQAAMGWTNSHLHMFAIGDVRFTVPYEPGALAEATAIDSRHVKLAQIIARKGFTFIYEYDLGDSWEHELLVESILQPDAQQKTPVCTGGERACPPEDVGGMWGYAEFLEAIGDPDHEEHDSYLEWIGGKFDPEIFDLDDVNARLRKLT
jgi:hypothetical protein